MDSEQFSQVFIINEKDRDVHNVHVEMNCAGGGRE